MSVKKSFVFSIFQPENEIEPSENSTVVSVDYNDYEGSGSEFDETSGDESTRVEESVEDFGSNPNVGAETVNYEDYYQQYEQEYNGGDYQQSYEDVESGSVEVDDGEKSGVETDRSDSAIVFVDRERPETTTPSTTERPETTSTSDSTLTRSLAERHDLPKYHY